jgi:hypothetical protein
MAIRIVNLPTFIETVGRRKIDRYNAFDQMTCVFIGPASLVDQYTPAVGSIHPQYSQMFVSQTQQTEKEGAIAEIQVTYAGFINGVAPNPTVSSRRVDNSGSYQVADSVIVNPGVPKMILANYGEFGIGVVQPIGFSPTPNWVTTGYTGRVTKIGTYTVSVRYLSSQGVVTYHVAGKRPPFPSQGPLASQYASFQIISTDRSTLSGSNSIDGVPLITVTTKWDWTYSCTNFSVTPITPNTFECQETWEWLILSNVSWNDF